MSNSILQGTTPSLMTAINSIFEDIRNGGTLT